VAHRLLHPRYQIPRRYRIEVWGAAGPAEARRLRQGVVLEDGIAQAEDVSISSIAEHPASKVSCEICLTLREGRKREVRRLMEALNLRVKRLVRVSFGPIGLGSLQPGEFRELSADEVNALKAVVGLRDSNGDT
jgi:23S rRNA pseudouridine2605 synthase